MRTIIYTQLEEKLIKDWLSLWNNSPFANYSNSPHWFMSLIETFNYKNFTIITIYNNEHLLAIAALIKKRIYGIELYAFPPENFVCGLPFLVNTQNKSLLRTLLSKLLKLGNVFIENSPEFLAKDLKEQTTKINAFISTLNYYINIIKDNDGQIVIRHKRKMMRRAQSIGKMLNLRSFNEQVTEALNVAFAIDNKSRKQTKGYNTFSNKQSKKFYRLLAKNFKEKFLVNILYYEKKPIAYEIGFLVNKTFYGSQIASLSSYDNYSIGRILLVHLIEILNKKGIEKLDFGSGEDHVKKSFTKDYILLYNIIISKNIFIRTYLHLILQLRTKIFNYLKRHIKLYTTYRILKNIIKH